MPKNYGRNEIWGNILAFLNYVIKNAFFVVIHSVSPKISFELNLALQNKKLSRIYLFSYFKAQRQIVQAVPSTLIPITRALTTR